MHISESFSYGISSVSVYRFVGYMEYLWPHINWALMWINMAEYWNYLTVVIVFILNFDKICGFTEFSEKSVYGIMKTTLLDESICPKFGITQPRLMKIFHVEFQQSLWKLLLNSGEIQFMTICKLDYIVNQCT
jgi:hypothetical protein